jgi:uncharacterized membrane protein YgcG
MRRKKRTTPGDPESTFNKSPASLLDRTVVLRPITPAGYVLIVINFILGAMALVPPLLWLMAVDNASLHPHGDVWAEFWKLAFPNIYIGTFLSILVTLTALTGASATFITLRTRGTADAAGELALQGAFMIVAAGVASGATGSVSSGGAKFGGGGATGSW